MGHGAETKRAMGEHLSGVVYGALAGATVVTLGFGAVLIGNSSPPPLSELWYGIGNLVLFSIYAFFAAFIAFALSILLVGVPARWGLRRIRMDNAFAATAAGFLLSGGAALALFFRGDVWSLAWILITAVAGGLAGFAYFRTSADRS